MQVAWGELFLCYCTVNKLLHGTRHLSCCGNPGVELVRKPALTVGLGGSGGTCWVTAAAIGKGLWSQQ